MTLSLFLCGLGLALIIEGILYFTMASHMKQLAEILPRVPEGVWRKVGLATMGAGLLLLYLFRPLR